MSDILQSKNPYQLMEQWLAEVKASGKVREPTAMILSTASTTGEPSSRTVLLKDLNENEGLTFFTNYSSRKGQELAHNPKASLLFYWDALFRQIKLLGEVNKLDRSRSETYWKSRPFESRVAGWLSKQSRPVETGVNLKKSYEDALKQWQGQEVPCPQDWGGYIFKPKQIEFWLGHTYRLHDRVLFRQGPAGWVFTQLYP